MSAVATQWHANGRLDLVLNRAEVHNAFDDEMIAELDAALAAAEQDSRVRVLLLRATGRSFSAGADLRWMARMAEASTSDNYSDALRFARMLERLDRFPHPVVAVVQGPAYGGGVGLIAACDIAIGIDSARFALSEVRLGLVPAVISPYVIRAMGERASRRYFLTAETFDAREAVRLGLLHELVEAAGFEARLTELLASLAAGGPQAHSAAKLLLHDIRDAGSDLDLGALTAGRIADLRRSPEGQEGIRAFIDKRKPIWTSDV